MIPLPAASQFAQVKKACFPERSGKAPPSNLLGGLFRFAGHGDEADGEENLAPDSLAGSAQADQILVPPSQRKNHPPALTQLLHEWLGDVAGSRGDDDGVEGRHLRPTTVAVAGANLYVGVAQAPHASFRLLGQRLNK